MLFCLAIGFVDSVYSAYKTVFLFVERDIWRERGIEHEFAFSYCCNVAHYSVIRQKEENVVQECYVIPSFLLKFV